MHLCTGPDYPQTGLGECPGEPDIGGHQVIKIMTRPLKYFHVYIYYFEEMQMHIKLTVNDTIYTERI